MSGGRDFWREVRGTADECDSVNSVDPVNPANSTEEVGLEIMSVMGDRLRGK